MARKVRRVRRPSTAGDVGGNLRGSKRDLSEEYAYVLSDLRRVLLLAALMFLLLIVLNLLI